MHFTIDSRCLEQVLKRLNVRRAMYPYVQIQAIGSKLCLLTMTRPTRYPSERSVQVSLQVKPATLDEEGSCAVPYSELLHAAKSLPGMLTVALQERALLVSGEGPLLCQAPLRLLDQEFPATAFKEQAENECYTKERSTRVECATCKQSHYAKVTDTYQVTKVLKQQIRISRDLLATMCAQVAWVAEPEESYRHALTAIRLELNDDVFELAAFDDCCFAIRKQILPGAGSWERPFLVPAARLTHALRLLPKGEDLLVETRATQHQLIKYGDEDASCTEPFVQENEVSLATEAMRISLSPIESKFFDAQKVMPTSEAAPMLCSTDELARAVNAMVPADKDESNAAWFTCGSATIRVEAKRDQLGTSAQYEVPVRQSPDREETTIILNSWYVCSLLKATTAHEVSLAFTGSRSPALFHSGGERDEYLVGLVPMERATK